MLDDRFSARRSRRRWRRRRDPRPSPGAAVGRNGIRLPPPPRGRAPRRDARTRAAGARVRRRSRRPRSTRRSASVPRCARAPRWRGSRSGTTPSRRSSSQTARKSRHGRCSPPPIPRPLSSSGSTRSGSTRSSSAPSGTPPPRLHVLRPVRVSTRCPTFAGCATRSWDRLADARPRDPRAGRRRGEVRPRLRPAPRRAHGTVSCLPALAPQGKHVARRAGAVRALPLLKMASGTTRAAMRWRRRSRPRSWPRSRVPLARAAPRGTVPTRSGAGVRARARARRRKASWRSIRSSSCARSRAGAATPRRSTACTWAGSGTHPGPGILGGRGLAGGGERCSRGARIAVNALRCGTSWRASTRRSRSSERGRRRRRGTSGRLPRPGARACLRPQLAGGRPARPGRTPGDYVAGVPRRSPLRRAPRPGRDAARLPQRLPASRRAGLRRRRGRWRS